MAKIGRYCGAIVVEQAGAQVLVGNPKEPCAVTETLAAPWTLALPASVPLSGCSLQISDGDLPAIARAVAERFVIERNGSVSERLWRLVTDGKTGGEMSAQWVIDAPMRVWQIVRDTVLKCS